MAYDFELIKTLLSPLRGARFVERPDSLAAEFADGVTLRFENAEIDANSLVRFDGTDWHHHGDFIFADADGNFATLEYGDVLLGLVDGTILVCERWAKGQLADRWLIHSRYADELRDIEQGEEIRIRRIAARA